MAKLTAAFVRTVKEPGRYSDGGGLLLQITKTGGRSWLQRIVIQGKRRDIGLGPLDRVSLASARQLAADNRAIARTGGDPTVAAAAPRVPTFAEGFEAVLDLKRPRWKEGGKSEAQWRATFRDYMRPLADMPLDAIATSHVLDVLAPIWHDRHETARRVKQRIGEVLEWGIAHDHRIDNPAQRVTRLLGTNGHHRQHFRALPYADVSRALAAVRESRRAWPCTKLAIEFLVLTAARSGEVRGASWGEIDLDAAVWTVPAGRMKMGRPHRVPLSSRALAVLREAGEYSDGGAGSLLFPAPRGGMLSDMTMSKLVKELGFDSTVHGFRSSFRQWAAERTNLPREVAEEALAHVNPNRVEAAYQRSDLFERRRDLMDTWARYLAAESAAVVAMEGRR